jgi:hypothetical protein
MIFLIHLRSIQEWSSPLNWSVKWALAYNVPVVSYQKVYKI